MNKFAKTLLPPYSLDVDVAYQNFCIIKNDKFHVVIEINYILCWDVECEYLYRTFSQSHQGDDWSLAARFTRVPKVSTALLAKRDRKRGDRWSVAILELRK